MRFRVAVFGALGVLATLGAAVAVLAPDLVASFLPAASLGGDARRMLLLASGAVALLLLWLGHGSAGETPRSDAFDALADRPPEAVTAARGRRTAAELDARIGAAVAGDEEALSGVRDRLREAATTAYAGGAGVDRETARTVVLRGEWTGDETAAAFLAGEAGPAHSPADRLRLWLDPGSERERRIRRAVAATRALEEGWA
ncbi:MAG: hypothetical protein ABEJ89_01715 [Haloarculaceae archaeon]